MMRTLEEYMALSYQMVIVEDSDEGGYVGYFPELPGCITTGETVEETVSNMKDAKKAWLEAAIEDGFSISEPSGSDFLKRLANCELIAAQSKTCNAVQRT